MESGSRFQTLAAAVLMLFFLLTFSAKIYLFCSLWSYFALLASRALLQSKHQCIKQKLPRIEIELGKKVYFIGHFK